MNEPSDILPLAQALRDWLPPGRNGKPTNTCTAWRWSTKGVRTPGGGTARLQILRIGGRLFLERFAVQAFLTACNPGGQNPAGSPAPDAPADDARKAATDEILLAAGIRRARSAK